METDFCSITRSTKEKMYKYSKNGIIYSKNIIFAEQKHNVLCFIRLTPKKS